MYKIIHRIVSRLRRDLAYFGIARRFQSFEIHKTRIKSEPKSILLVASGSVQIPTDGWGAVETIIAETIPTYLESGINVGLLNSQNIFEWRKASRITYDAIICHSDTHLRKVQKMWPSTPVIAVTHYGLAALPELWHPSYKRVFPYITAADKVVCLSPAIISAFQQHIPKDKLILAGNGSAFNSVPIEKKESVFVVVGKVEERKRQYELSQYASEHSLDIRFIGPIEDQRVEAAIRENPDLRNVFLGERSRNELADELPRYRGLILLSQAEADALVLYEAQLAGLEIIVNRESLGSQDSNLSWVHVISNFEEINVVAAKVIKTPISPHTIAKHADQNYRWNYKLKPILDLIESISQNAK